jgi:hypothetical protein
MMENEAMSGDLRIRAFVIQGLGLGCRDERLRGKAAKLIRRAADILDALPTPNPSGG